MVTPADFDYTFETIDVSGVDFLELAASSDFEDYAGNTLSADGTKRVGFTLIDGVFNTFDYPGSQNTYFYALGNNGNAAGYYEDSDGLHHGVILENGELRQYDFPNAVQTEIYGISDATGVLTGNWTDALGVRRGFSGDKIIAYPGASATYADFVNARGVIVGSYIDSDGLYHTYASYPYDGFISIDFQDAATLEYLFVHGINDADIAVARSKVVGDVPRTYIGPISDLQEFQFPGSVSTEGYNINQDGSVVGHYDTADGRRHGFIAKPITEEVESDAVANTYQLTLASGLNMISLPLMPSEPYTARSFAKATGATVVIQLDTAMSQFVGFTADQAGDGFAIEGGQGYIVNVPGGGVVTFEGTAWDNTIAADVIAAPAVQRGSTDLNPRFKSVDPLPRTGWAFVVSGDLRETEAGAAYTVVAKNQRTGEVATRQVTSDDTSFNAVWADLTRGSVIEAGDTLAVVLLDDLGNIVSGPFRHRVGVDHLQNAYLSLPLTVGDVHPAKTLLGQNFPNPFNPETWIPYQLEQSADVVLQIYDTSGGVVRTIDIGFKPQGFYLTRNRAAYWDGRNNMGETVASGVYFYSLQTPDFSATQKMLILK